MKSIKSLAEIRWLWGDGKVLKNTFSRNVEIVVPKCNTGFKVGSGGLAKGFSGEKILLIILMT